ncbi:hypothetical protein [Erwinia sp. HR93]|uniref:hypothetical protein n=1 Tax=Erwinia sp. HR93 TaxID=3094840 RepID=UPI002ADECB95|nr:hypothetical protein [Erwinia sp. HR93]MEA1062894.1 hypothetical protein [Erwinia sp. HR93]
MKGFLLLLKKSVILAISGMFAAYSAFFPRFVCSILSEGLKCKAVETGLVIAFSANHFYMKNM